MAIDYRSRVRKLDRSHLITLLDRCGEGATPGWAAGKAFEYGLLRSFELEGIQVTGPYRVVSRGATLEEIDGALHFGMQSFLIEAKDRSEAVNVEPIAKMRNQLARRPPGTMGIVFARRGFTEAAKELARYISPLSILLWEFDEYLDAVKSERLHTALLAKHRYAVEMGAPDFDHRGAAL